VLAGIERNQLNLKDKLGSIKAKMKPPSISLSCPESQDYLILKLSLESGEYQYEDKKEIIDNWIIAFKIKIGFEALPQSDFRHNGTNGPIPDSIVDKINKGIITVYHIFLDFENSDLTKIDANLTQIPKINFFNMDKFIKILGSFLKSKIGSANPFNIGYFAITKDGYQTRDMMPIIRPTYCRYSLYKSRLKEDLNRINILFMMDGHEPPKDFHFGEELDCYQNGVIIISKSIFEHNLLETIILPEFLSSIQEQFSSNHEYPILKMIHEGLDYHSIGCNGWVKSNRIYSYKQDHTRLLLDSHIFYDNDIVFPSENLFLAHDPRISPEQDHRNPL
jgi:hypothetical protein